MTPAPREHVHRRERDSTEYFAPTSGGTLYFSTSDHIASLAAGSSQPKTIVSGLRSAGMLQVAGENLVWVDPLSRASVPTVETTCVH